MASVQSRVGHLAMTQSEFNPAEDRQQTNLPLHDALIAHDAQRSYCTWVFILKIIILGVKNNIISWIVRISSQFQSILNT